MSYVFYGSETGQSKSIAEGIFEVLSIKTNFKLCELDEINKSFSIDKINLAIIICSTTGDGDPPENAARFLRKIKSYKENSLTNLRYTVLGLGDTNYTNFCNCGKSIDSLLTKIGGRRFYGSKWADDAVGLELVVEPWLEGLYKIISGVCAEELVPLLETVTISDKSADLQETRINIVGDLLGDIHAANISDFDLCVPLLPVPFLHIAYHGENIIETIPLVSTVSLPADKSGLCNSKLVEIKKITNRYAVKSVYQVTLSIAENTWVWSPGDSIGILPCNPFWEVDEILSRLQVPLSNRNCLISFSLLQTTKKNTKIPEHLVVQSNKSLSLRNILAFLCDIRAPLNKAGLRIMAEYCPDGSSEQRRLLQLCSKEGQSLYIRSIREPCMPILDLLNWFPSCNITIERLLEVLPRLKPRAYSLCDCKEISFAFSKVDIAPVQGFRKRPLTGICTTWMENMTKLDHDIFLPVYLRKNLNSFTVSNPEDPHILIGPGTGVAPFISFLQYFENLKKNGENIGPIWLFFGCRNKERDFIFKNHLEYFLKEDILSHLCVCFSRDLKYDRSDHNDLFCVPEDCKYVQDCMVHHSQDLAPLVIDRGARIYVCGDASGLAKDVLSTWSTILMSYSAKSLTKKDADGYIAKMRINRLYLEDVWL